MYLWGSLFEFRPGFGLSCLTLLIVTYRLLKFLRIHQPKCFLSQYVATAVRALSQSSQPTNQNFQCKSSCSCRVTKNLIPVVKPEEHESRSHFKILDFKILDFRKVAWNKFHTDRSQIGVAAHNLVSRTTWPPGLVHPELKKSALVAQINLLAPELFFF